MNTWLTPMCQGSATEDATNLGIICAVLAALLLIAITLGFWPLRTWLGVNARHGRLVRRSPGEASSLFTTWRLYRRLWREAHFSVPDVPSVMVPNRVAEGAQGSPPASGSTTAYYWMRYRRPAILVDIDG
jgi:hypothetical protein